MGKTVRKARAFFGGMLRGIESPAEAFVINVYTYPHVSEQAAMRSDWIRVGGEMQKALTKLDGQTSPRSAR